MVSDPLTDGCYLGHPNTIDVMLIACPNCSTSYMIDPASLGDAGRTVRCARCRMTWFASKPEMADAASDAADNDAPSSIGVIRPDKNADGDSGDVPDVPAEQGTEVGTPARDEAAAQAPVTITDAPPLAPAESSATSETDEIENFVARRKRLQVRRKKERRSSRWTALILVLFAFNVALVGARNEIVRFFPQTASLFAAVGLPVNLRQLKFENMRISKETQEGLSALVIEGSIVSVSSKPTEVPRLRFAARDASGQEVYTWSALPGRSILGPGEKLEFRSRFVSPPPNATDVMVRFVTPQDSTAAAK